MWNVWASCSRTAARSVSRISSQLAQYALAHGSRSWVREASLPPCMSPRTPFPARRRRRSPLLVAARPRTKHFEIALVRVAGRLSLGCGLRPGSERREESVSECVHPPDRGTWIGLEARLPTPLRDVRQHRSVAGEDADRNVAADSVAGHDRRGLMITKEDDYQIVIAVGLHIGDEAAQ